MVENSGRIGRVVSFRTHIELFFSNFNATVTTLSRDASVITYANTLKKSFSHSFKPYMNTYITAMAKSGKATTMLIK